MPRGRVSNRQAEKLERFNREEREARREEEARQREAAKRSEATQRLASSDTLEMAQPIEISDDPEIEEYVATIMRMMLLSNPMPVSLSEIKVPRSMRQRTMRQAQARLKLWFGYNMVLLDEAAGATSKKNLYILENAMPHHFQFIQQHCPISEDMQLTQAYLMVVLGMVALHQLSITEEQLLGHLMELGDPPECMWKAGSKETEKRIRDAFMYFRKMAYLTARKNTERQAILTIGPRAYREFGLKRILHFVGEMNGDTMDDNQLDALIASMGYDPVEQDERSKIMNSMDDDVISMDVDDSTSTSTPASQPTATATARPRRSRR